MLPADQPESILIAARILRDGGVVVIPTDTVYGLAASIFQDEAVRRVYRLKMRPVEKRVPVLLGTAADIVMLAEPPSPVTWTLIDSFWPGAITLVLPASRPAPKVITQGRNTVALRVPANKACLELLQSLGEPIVGTSANLSGGKPATSAVEAASQLSGADAVLLDDAHIAVGTPSTILEVGPDKLVVLRVGAVSPDSIRQAVGSLIPVEEKLPLETVRR